MPPTAPIAMGLMVAAGVVIAVQAPINAALYRGLGSPIAAATISFGVGFLLLLLCTILFGDAHTFTALPSLPSWLLVGGALGAFFVFSALWSVPVLGVLTVTGLVVLGQIGAALVLDHYGAFGLTVREISPTRLLSGVLLVAGVILSRL
ncbi:DMT family transporter [Roseovarius faecimaris]|uniref:DMT family transporter n=1 Tax=Roseovarius faecimaris TaxID=2494550 RepID=A0A6I6IR62_9RHOB|nr:DMT family transporter [Roseovarius faecimaris]QGX98047.1 DMT family transporter [Roseovarius faecimaris]